MINQHQTTGNGPTNEQNIGLVGSIAKVPHFVREISSIGTAADAMVTQTDLLPQVRDLIDRHEGSEPLSGPSMDQLTNPVSRTSMGVRVERARDVIGEKAAVLRTAAGESATALREAATEVAPEVRELFVELGAPIVGAALYGAGLEAGVLKRSGEVSKAGTAKVAGSVIKSRGAAIPQIAHKAAEGARNGARIAAAKQTPKVRGATKSAGSIAHNFTASYRSKRSQQKAH